MFELFVATPDKVIFDAKARMLLAPGNMGIFEVLSRHAPMVSLLGRGKIVIMDQDKNKRAWMMTSGFFEVNNNKAILLADSLEPCEV